MVRSVPFRLVSPKGNFVRIDKPLEFDCIQDQLETIHVKFDPNTNSSFEKLLDAFVGKVSTGIETHEQMLLINAPLTGVGRLEKRAGLWHLTPHRQWGGILTSASRSDILSEHRTRSTVIRLLSLTFGLAASCTAGYLIYCYYLRQRRATPRLPDVSTVIDANREPRPDAHAPNNRLQCVICLENEITYSLQPCSHLGLCHSCAQHLQAASPSRQLCPMCRTPIQQYQRIFLP